MIKTIPMWAMMMATKGKKTGLAVLASLPIFIVTGAWVFLDGLQNGQKRQAAMGLICLIFFSACTVLFAPSKKYIPGKTFQGYRNKRLSTTTAINYGYGVIVFIFAVFVFLAPEYALNAVGYGLLGLFSLYVLSKSLKFHADIDSSTNEYLTTALGFPAGEKILVSYQNFDAGAVEVGSNAFAATATKLTVASFDGGFWRKLSRDLDQVARIGVIGDENQNYFVKLQFIDGADALLRIGLYDKLTSSPTLVIRKLLEAIDASLLGNSGASPAAQRRRVVVNSGTSSSISKTFAPEAAPVSKAPMRNVEVAPDVLVAIQNAEEDVPRRRLEL
ncbi:hypothetical protein [Pseudomonas sp. T1.Ur]|uniref:hypothetical protein n=1 Tax=Pseudomonas sp. T1.Ur TaxID=2928704 RepID=UPI00201E4388|nr:hypothetical protein [Pseudomonas sp. T1.Ur]MCL6701514.1 hypothetical protein [Pseudomonas sp. T1.Ur]